MAAKTSIKAGESEHKAVNRCQQQRNPTSSSEPTRPGSNTISAEMPATMRKRGETITQRYNSQLPTLRGNWIEL